mgnify:CR=1 FL=1
MLFSCSSQFASLKYDTVTQTISKLYSRLQIFVTRDNLQTETVCYSLNVSDLKYFSSNEFSCVVEKFLKGKFILITKHFDLKERK